MYCDQWQKHSVPLTILSSVYIHAGTATSFFVSDSQNKDNAKYSHKAMDVCPTSKIMK